MSQDKPAAESWQAAEIPPQNSTQSWDKAKLACSTHALACLKARARGCQGHRAIMMASNGLLNIMAMLSVNVLLACIGHQTVDTSFTRLGRHRDLTGTQT